MRLTAKERILLYLLEVSPSKESVEVSPDLTQESLARGSWIGVRHVPQYVRPLVHEGLVRERQSHVKGIRQRRKVYDLTDSGRLAATRLRQVVRGEPVQVRDVSGVRESTVSQAVRESGGRWSLLEVARQSMETGTVDLSGLVAAPGTAEDNIPPVALRLEREYNWLGAAGSYQSASVSLPKTDIHGQGSLLEHLAYALHRAAFQAGQPEEFRERTERALESCEKARDAYKNSRDVGSAARVFRCGAMAAYLRFWLATSIDERRKHLDEAWKSTEATLKELEEAGAPWEYGTTVNRLSLVPVLKLLAEWDVRSQEPVLRESIEHGERAIRALSAFRDQRELAQAYARTAHNLNILSVRLAGLDERGGLSQKAIEYWRKARELSEETALLEPFSGPAFAGDGTDETLAMVEKALVYARKTDDRLLLGWVLEGRAYQRYWKALTTEDLDEWRTLLKEGLEDSANANRQFASIAFANMLAGSFTGEGATAEYYHELSRRELDLRTRYELLKTGLDGGREGLTRAEAFGFPDALVNAHAPCADILIALSEMEQNPDTKKKWLQEALVHIDELDWMIEQRGPTTYFSRGDLKIARARAKSELADLAGPPGVRIGMLKEAVEDAESGLDLCVRDMAFYGGRGETSGYAYIGSYLSKSAAMYNRLFRLTGDRAYLRRATEMLERVADLFRRADRPSRVAELHWEAAKIHDSLEDHLTAADQFSIASTTYKTASDRVPQLKDFYQDLALYMQAWSEIEKARHHHSREEYGQAKDYYERAATLHGFSKRWGFMAPNYAAWAQLEGAEDLSRSEKSPEAIVAFRKAGGLFREARVSLEGALGKMQDFEERRVVDALVKAAERRWQYCASRIAMEDAKILDKRGEYSSSSQKYGQAADDFEKLVADVESDRDRRDLSLIATLAKAWQAMAKAETEESPELYQEAIRFFEEAKEFSPNEKAKALALGHSRLCNALAEGLRFAKTQKPAHYSSAMKHFDSAVNFYAKAGATGASEYVRAAKLFLDAYASMDRGGQETAREKRANAYLEVEKVLEASATAYGSAGQPGKRDQVLRLLENVKKERELAASLTEILRESSLLFSSTAFVMPTASHEEAVGLERFEHADIQARLILDKADVVADGVLEVEVAIVNAGKGPAQLVKVEHLVPEGFEVVRMPEKYHLEEGCLDFNGKRMDPMRAEEVRLILKPRVPGRNILNPRIFYLDEAGKYRSHDPEPVEVTVERRALAQDGE